MLDYIRWYYSEGIRKFILIWRTFLDFILFYFSIVFFIKNSFFTMEKRYFFCHLERLTPSFIY